MVQPVSLIFFCQQSIRHQKTHHLDHQIWSDMLSQPSVSFHQVALAILSAFSGACTVLLVQLPMKALTLDSLDLRPVYTADFHSESSLGVSAHVMQSSSDCINLCPFTLQQLIHGLSPGQVSGVDETTPHKVGPTETWRSRRSRGSGKGIAEPLLQVESKWLRPCCVISTDRNCSNLMKLPVSGTLSQVHVFIIVHGN